MRYNFDSDTFETVGNQLGHPVGIAGDNELGVVLWGTRELGAYRFVNLPIGEYTMKVEAPENYSFTLKEQGDDRDLDSNVDENGETEIMMLTSGMTDKSIDVGLKGFVLRDIPQNSAGVDHVLFANATSSHGVSSCHDSCSGPDPGPIFNNGIGTDFYTGIKFSLLAD